MHELQMAGILIDSVLDAASDYSNVVRVDEVEVTIGRLAFLGDEQLRFCFEALSEERDLLRGCRITIKHEEAAIRCLSCGYEGGLDVIEDPTYHYIMPVFACPRCKGEIDIERGKSVHITNVKLILDDDPEDKDAKEG